MMQRLFIMVLVLSTVSVVSVAQLDVYNGKNPIVISQGGVKHIYVSGDIGLVLRQETGDGVNVRMDKDLSDKVKVTVHGEKLYITSKATLPNNEKLVVFGWFNNLESLTIKGNSMVASIGVLDYQRLTVNMDDQARVSLRTTGKILMHAPQNANLIQYEQYHSVTSGTR